ncbi:hypothetical protein FGB62_92g122 [Gracilaria domingensis]|nr:hypothetical protein FGB62_92g122 [Gracilaria domingensis]
MSTSKDMPSLTEISGAKCNDGDTSAVQTPASATEISGANDSDHDLPKASTSPSGVQLELPQRFVVASVLPPSAKIICIDQKEETGAFYNDTEHYDGDPFPSPSWHVIRPRKGPFTPASRVEKSRNKHTVKKRKYRSKARNRMKEQAAARARYRIKRDKRISEKDIRNSSVPNSKVGDVNTGSFETGSRDSAESNISELQSSDSWLVSSDTQNSVPSSSGSQSSTIHGPTILEIHPHKEGTVEIDGDIVHDGTVVSTKVTTLYEVERWFHVRNPSSHGCERKGPIFAIKRDLKKGNSLLAVSKR